MSERIDINKRLDDIIIKYDIDEYYPGFRKKNRALELIDEMCQLYMGQEVLVVYNYIYEKRIFDSISNDRLQLKYMDTDNTRDLETINYKEYDKVVYISYNAHISVEQIILSRTDNYVWLYDFFAMNGLIIYDEFYNIAIDNHEKYCGLGNERRKNLYSPCVEMSVLKRKLEKCSDNKLKECYLKKLIFFSLYLRDLSNYSKYYSQLKDISTFVNYNEANTEINHLIMDIKSILSKRRTDDIIMYWMDALPYRDHNDMPFLCEQLAKGIEFTNAYTVTPHTNSVLTNIFCKRMTVDDKVYTVGEISEHNSGLIKYLKNKGYMFKSISGVFNQNRFAKEYVSNRLNSIISTCSELLYNAVEELLNSSEKTFILVHMVAEAHPPFLTSETSIEALDSKYVAYGQGRASLDKQLNYYDSFFAKDATKIYFSDHGQPDTYRDWLHTVLGVVSGKTKKEKIEKLFSYIDFDIFIKAIIENEDIAEALPDRMFVQTQQLPYYDSKVVYDLIKNRKCTHSCTGWKGVINAEELYLEFGTGKGMYIGEENTSLHLNADMIENRGMECISDDKFKYSRYIFKVFENQKKRAGWDAKNIINMLFDKIKVDELVGLRGGGEHTLQILLALSDKNKAKVKYIIDKGAKDVRRMYGIEAICPEEIESYGATTVFLSSFKWLKEFKTESKEYPSSCKVVDIYEEFYKLGMDIRQEFWLCELEETDYDVDFPYEIFEW